VPSTTESIRIAQAIQAMEAAVGIEVVIDTADAATVVARQTRGSSTSPSAASSRAPSSRTRC
jgi:hypothetical protein